MLDCCTSALAVAASACRYVWSSSADGGFTIAEDKDGPQLGRGTLIRLHLKPEALEYAEESKLRELVGKYSEFINFPIYLQVEKEVEVPVEEEEEAAEPAGDELKAEEVEDDTEDEDETDGGWVGGWVAGWLSLHVLRFGVLHNLLIGGIQLAGECCVPLCGDLMSHCRGGPQEDPQGEAPGVGAPE